MSPVDDVLIQPNERMNLVNEKMKVFNKGEFVVTYEKAFLKYLNTKNIILNEESKENFKLFIEALKNEKLIIDDGQNYIGGGVSAYKE